MKKERFLQQVIQRKKPRYLLQIPLWKSHFLPHQLQRGHEGNLLLQALPTSHPGLPGEAQEQMGWISSSRAAQHGDMPCREENQETRLARDQIVTKRPSINGVRKLEGLEAWRNEVLEQVPAGAVAARSPRSLKWSFMNRFYYAAASNSKG